MLVAIFGVKERLESQAHGRAHGDVDLRARNLEGIGIAYRAGRQVSGWPDHAISPEIYASAGGSSVSTRSIIHWLEEISSWFALHRVSGAIMPMSHTCRDRARGAVIVGCQSV